MTVTVQSVVDRVQTTLQDTSGVRWAVASELVLWVNDAQREIALFKPDATAVNETVALATGTKQAIPTEGNRLLNVVRNMGMVDKTYTVTVVNASGNKFYVDGSFQNLALEEGGTYTFDQSQSSNGTHPLRFSTTANGTHGSGAEYTSGVVVAGTPGSSGAYTKITVPVGAPTLYTYCTAHSGMGFSATTTTRVGLGKRSIRLVDSAVLNAQTPDWHDASVTGGAAHANIVKHWVYDTNNPRDFYVYPGVSGSAYVEIVYSLNPATVTASDNLGVPDIFANAIFNYVLYMAYMKDAEFAPNQQRAASHYQLFLSSVTGKGQLDALGDPNAERRTSLAAV